MKFQEKLEKWLKHFTNKALIRSFLSDHSWFSRQLLTHPFSHPLTVDLLMAVARHPPPACLFALYAPVPPLRHARHSRKFFICFVLAPALLQKYSPCYTDYSVRWPGPFKQLLPPALTLYFSGPFSSSRLFYPSSSLLHALCGVFLSLSTTELGIFDAPEELVTSSHKFQLNLGCNCITNSFWSIRSLTRHTTLAEVC